MKNTLLGSYIKLVTASLLYGMIVFGGKVMSMNGFSLVEILIVPYAIVCLILIWFVRQDFKKFLKIPLWIILAYLATCITAQIGQYGPLFMGLSVSLVVFLLYTQPLWTTLISVLFLKNPFTRREAVLVVLMVLGLVFLLSPWQDFNFSIWGFILALIGGVSFSSWVIISSYFSKNGIRPVSLAFLGGFFTTIPFILAYPLFIKIFPDPAISGFTFFDRPVEIMATLALYAVTVFIFAHLLFYSAAKRINNIHLGLVLLLEPVVASGLDVTFLGTNLTWNMMLGGALILGANAYLVTKSAEKE